VDEFVITGGKILVSVTALGMQAATVPLPDIRLQDLGTGPDGITPAELTKLVLEAIETKAAQAASGAAADISKGALNAVNDPGNTGTNPLQNVTRGLGDFLKKK
jgi:hypothetical protein